MSDASATAAAGAAHRAPPPAGFSARLRGWAALIVAGAIFCTLGRSAFQPIDPRGPLMLLATDHRARTLVAMGLLAVVSAVLGVIVAGRNAATIGPLCVAVGLAAMNWRGAPAEFIGGYLTGDPAAPAWPSGGMTFELWLWLGLIALGSIIGRWSAGRLSRRDPRPVARRDSTAPLPALGGAVAAAIIAFVLIRLLGGERVDAVLKQQVYFSVAVACFVAAYLVERLVRPALWWWPILAVGLLGSAAYLLLSPGTLPETETWGTLRALTAGPTRPLPIEYAALGMVGCLLGVDAARSPESTGAAAS